MGGNMRKLASIALVALIGLSIHCVSGIGGPDLNGSLYTSVQRSESIPSKVGAREGESCQSGFLGLVATGDASVEGAAKSGNVRELNSISFKRTAVLGSLFMKNCTIVTGN
jgi:hypothetical protein